MSSTDRRPSVAGHVALGMLINGVLPFCIYRLSAAHLGAWPALVLASVPPLLNSARALVLRHHVDAIGLLALTGIVLNLISLALGGTAQALLLRGSVISGLFGVIYLASFLLPRPLFFYIARFFETGDEVGRVAEWNQLWASSTFRYRMRLLTVGWGIGLLAEGALRVVLVYMLTVDQFLLIAAVLDYAVLVGLTGWSIWYGKRMKQA